MTAVVLGLGEGNYMKWPELQIKRIIEIFFVNDSYLILCTDSLISEARSEKHWSRS